MTLTNQVLIVLGCGLWLTQSMYTNDALWTNLQLLGKRMMTPARPDSTHRLVMRPFSLAFNGRDSGNLCSTCEERKRFFLKQFKM